MTVGVCVRSNNLNLTNRFSQFEGFLQLVVALYIARVVNAAAEERACQTALREAVYPSREAGNGTFGRLFIVLGSSSKQIYVAEPVVQRIQGVQAVDERLHLSAHFIVIDGRCPANDIGLQDLGHDVVHIVLDDAAAQLLAGEAAPAELDFFARKGNLFNIISCTQGPFNELISENIAVRAMTKARRNNYYSFHSIYCFIEYVTVTLPVPKNAFNSSAVFPSTFPRGVYDQLLFP